MATYNGQEVGWIDEMFTTKEHKSRGSDRPSPDPEPTPGNKAKRRKGQSDEPVVVAVTTRKEVDDPIDQSYNGFDLSWLEEPGEGIATKKWSAAARKAALAARRAKSRAKGGLGGGGADGGGKAVTVEHPRAVSQALRSNQRQIDRNTRALRTEKDPDQRAFLKTRNERLQRGMQSTRMMVQDPKAMGTSPHAGAQRAAQKRSGSNAELGVTSQNPTRSADKGTTVAGASKPAQPSRREVMMRRRVDEWNATHPDHQLTMPPPTPKRNK